MNDSDKLCQDRRNDNQIILINDDIKNYWAELTTCNTWELNYSDSRWEQYILLLLTEQFLSSFLCYKLPGSKY